MKAIKTVVVNTGFAVLFLICTQFSSFAQARMDNSSPVTSASKIQFAGIEDDMLIFDLRLQGLPAGGCKLEIIDDAGNAIFENWISDSSYTKRYKIARNGSSKIGFEVAGKGFFFSQAFTIRTEERILVTKEEKGK